MNNVGSNHCGHCDHAMADHSADGTECEWCPEGYCESRARAQEPDCGELVAKHQARADAAGRATAELLGVVMAGQPAFLNAHPDARRAVETFYATGDDATSQGWEDTAALISLILPPECREGRCEH